MALQLKVSNSLNNLATKFADDLKANTYSVFKPYHIVTQTIGMNNWLKLTLAENLGILANYKFLKPNDVVNQIYYLLNGKDKTVIDTQCLQWVVYTTLNEKTFTSSFKHIAGYYLNHDVKRIALSEKLADLFDQYQIYRPELIAAWNADKLITTDTDEIWQKWLWQKAKYMLGDGNTDRLGIHEFILAQLKVTTQQDTLKKNLPSINFFGLSIITKVHIDLFRQISEYIDVTFYVLNPAPNQYWMDDMTEKQIARSRNKTKTKSNQAEGNALLVGWGKIIKDTFTLFFHDETFLNKYDDTASEEPKTDTLLGKLQNDIYNNLIGNDRNKIFKADLHDGSLTINSCFTPVREVEVLYNYLTNLVENSKVNFSVRDVVVMISDVNAYAPYIKAVFDNAKYKFPYTIADQNFTSDDSLFTALVNLLEINEDNFRAETVLQLLDSKYIRKRFNIVNLSIIRKAVRNANIRFGINGQINNDTNLVSFRNGLNRLIYGICLKGEDAYNLNGEEIYPTEISEGSETAQLIHFFHFIDVLVSNLNNRSEKRNIADWVSFTEELIENLILETDEGTDNDLKSLSYHFEKLNLISDTISESISFEVYKKTLLSKLNTETRLNSFASGGITFCSLIPMRSIPFDTLAILGLNLNMFPRKESLIGFNLIQKNKKLGDRDVKDNDKHLFLETILSAKKNLYISFIGRDPNDNSAIPPSALVDELIDYIDSGINPPIQTSKELITVHPLHAFSKQYNSTEDRLYSYLGDESNALENPEKNPEIPKQIESIQITDLISFFKNPFKYYYNKTFGIYYETQSNLLEETELFELDFLQNWVLKNNLIHIEESELEAYRLELIKKGKLPLKNVSKIVIENTYKEIRPVKNLFDTCKNGAKESQKNINLKIGEHVLTGKINSIYNDRLIGICFTSKEYKYLLELHLKHLILKASGHKTETYYVSKVNNKIYKALTISQKEAINQLNFFVDLFIEGNKTIVPYFPNLSESPQKLIDADELRIYEILRNEIIVNKSTWSELYLKREFEDGYFEKIDVRKTFLKNYTKIHGYLNSAFNTYFN